jgi:very-short-patch-repair endonuclease
LLDRSRRPAFTRSEAEERLLSLIRRARLPDPEVNVQLEGLEVDFLWREQGLVVEVDGFRYHSSPSDFENDRRRDAELLARGLRVLRVSAAQIVHEPEATLVRIGQALVSRGRG